MTSPEIVPGSPEAIKLAEAIREYSSELAKNRFGEKTAEIRERFSSLPGFTDFADSLDKFNKNLSALKKSEL